MDGQELERAFYLLTCQMLCRANAGLLFQCWTRKMAQNSLRTFFGFGRVYKHKKAPIDLELTRFAAAPYPRTCDLRCFVRPTQSKRHSDERA